MENNFLLESLSACHNSNSKLVMYFTVNITFVNYLETFDNLTDFLKFPIFMNRTTYEHTLPIYLNLPRFDSKLLTSQKTLKDSVHQYCHKKETFNMQERHTDMELEFPKKISFLTIIL